jgi:ATP-binding cassette, subfamily B, bacterial MsbA
MIQSTMKNVHSNIQSQNTQQHIKPTNRRNDALLYLMNKKHMALHDVLNLLMAFVKEHPLLVSTNMLFLFVFPIQDIILPHFYGIIMDNVSRGNEVNQQLIIVISLLVITQVLSLFADYHNSKLIPIMETWLRTHILQRILDKYEEKYTELEIGQIIAKMTKLPHIIVQWLDKFKNFILPYIIVYTCAMVYFYFVDKQLCLSFVLTVSTCVSVLVRSPFACSVESTQRDIQYHEIHKHIDDILSNLFAIYGGGQQKEELIKLEEFADNYKAYFKTTMTCAVKHMSMMTPVVVGFIVFFVMRSQHLVLQKQMPSSTFVSIFIIFLYILNSFNILNDQLRELIFDWGAIESSTLMLFGEDEPHENGRNNKIDDNSISPPTENGIGLLNVSFKYPNSDRLILKDVSLHINEGERVCLVGDIGSGKSTILKLLLQYQQPVSGIIYLNGKSYKKINVRRLRSYIGYVPQQSILFNRSILENILYGNKTHTRQDVIYAIKYFGLQEEFARFDKGLDTQVGKNGSKLSGGQRQLVWCLRVVLQNPQIIILDEPTASIDEKTKESMHKMLDTIMKDKTVIMVTHDDFLEGIATRIIRLSNGRIVEKTS